MIITIAGKPGSGKSTVAKLVAKELRYKHYSIGNLMRQVAKEKNVSLLKLSRLAEKNPKIDLLLDKKSALLGKQKDNFVMDTRLGFYFIPHSIKIFLDVNLNTAAKRILKNKRKNEKYKNIKEAKKKLLERMKSEKMRYKKYYNINHFDKKHFDIVINTSKKSPKLIKEHILKKIRKV